ncbi:MAG: type II toxin-antitoxin system RelE/ParE family toxin [Alphaproteobacteria bacterium]
MIHKLKKVPAVCYRTISGSEPVRAWLLELNKTDRSNIGRNLMTVEFGWPIGMPVCRPMGNGLYEVRSNLPGNRTARVLFCIHMNQLVLLHGFLKKSRGTPQKDLDLARKRQREVEQYGG